MPNPGSSGHSGTTYTARKLQQKAAGGDAQNFFGTEMTITPRYGQALLWADALHRKQRRKGKPVPYISHLISVSALVWEDGGTEDQAIAALLHDAIEDADQSHESIAARFGGTVASTACRIKPLRRMSKRSASWCFCITFR